MAFLFRFCVLESGKDDVTDKVKLEQENDELNDKNDALNKKIQEMEEKYRELNNLHSKLQQETDETKTENNKLKELLQEYKDDYHTIQLQLSQYESWLKKSKNKNKELQDIIDEMKTNQHENEDDSQLSILGNVEKRQQSLELLSGDNNGFIKFITKMIVSSNTDKIWAKSDPNNSGKIETEKIAKFLSLLVIFYQLSKHKKQNKTGKPNIDKEQIKESVQHLSIWMIVNYGEKCDDNSFKISLLKNDFETKLVTYFQAYLDASGM